MSNIHGLDRHELKDFLVNIITTTQATHNHAVAIRKQMLLNPSWTPTYKSELERTINNLTGAEQREARIALSLINTYSKDVKQVFQWVMNSVRECAQDEIDASTAPDVHTCIEDMETDIRANVVQQEAEAFFKEYERKRVFEHFARNPPNLTQPIVEETKPMKPFNKVAYNEIFNQKADLLSVDQLIGYITQVNDQIVALEKVPAESKKIGAMLTQLREDKANIVAELDSRD